MRSYWREKSMKWKGRVAETLFRCKKLGRPVFLPLIDPEKPPLLERVQMVLERATAILIGGSLNVTPYDIDELISSVRHASIDKPIILFPGGLNNIARNADAILFMSLLNSNDVYWVIGAQVSAAPIIAKLGLEALPTAYIIIGEGGAAGHVGRAQYIPPEKPELVAAYTLAAKLLGMRFVYLEAGSGARRHIPPEAIAAARKAAGQEIFLIAGGGIRTPDTAAKILEAGADAIVVGTLIEKNPEAALEIAEAINPCQPEGI